MLPAVFLVLEGCGQKFQSVSTSTVASALSGSVACASSRSQIFDAYAQAYRASTDMTDTSFENALHAQRLNPTQTNVSTKQAQARFEISLKSINQLMTKDLAAAKASVRERLSNAQSTLAEGEDDDLLHLARLEMRSEIDPSYAILNAKMDAALAEAAHSANEAGVSCTTPNTFAVQPNAASTSAQMASPIRGAHYVMATAYQSCQSLSLPLVDASTSDVQGVVRGAKIDAVGYGRVYTDVALLKRTHYYHRGQTYGPSCANQDKAPLVYDYGGKPAITAGALDLFTNNDGGPALGVDCSAFVSTAAAIAGNLYNTSTANKASYTRFLSRDFINPKVSGWNCYDSVKVAPNAYIQAGDIAAVEGHVVMIDQVGTDPFGLAKANTPVSCGSLSYKNFDFAIIQSSPSKNSLGINRFVIKDYLVNEPKMRTMFLGYAQQACMSKFDKNVRTPVTSAYGIIRHKQTRSCLAPKMALRNESCIAQCSSLN